MKKWWMVLLMLGPVLASAQPYTRQDTLRGSNGRGRDWWDVQKYDLSISIDTATKSISGTNTIVFRFIGEPRDSMQIDLQEGMTLDSAILPAFLDAQLGPDKAFIFKDGNVWWVKYPFLENKNGYMPMVTLHYHGQPRVAKNPPWDGGFIWTKDSTGKPWTAVACQGLGASSWWPCKDYQGDEPDSGMVLRFAGGYALDAITNGYRGSKDTIDTAFYKSYGWNYDASKIYRYEDYHGTIVNPINTYNTTFYIGDYAHYHDTLHGEKGILDLDFYPLKYNLERAEKQWAVTKEMLHCFEYWMGPYPFYEDGYKLVEAPYLGMEHQSAVAYGNQYKMGYLGHDRSGTGVGLAFDFIIVHESGHEWFGNSITAQDIADNWLHEGFTTYTEALFAEWIKGRDSAFAYTTGEWKNIRNDRPVIGDYGVNKEGSNDMYDKGSAVVHMIRMMLHDDRKFRQLLRGLNKDFYHKIVTSKEVEDYISRFVGMDLKPFFDVYLRSSTIPTLIYQKPGGKNKTDVQLRDVPENFSLPVYSRAGAFLFNLTTKLQPVRWEQLDAVQDYLLLKKMSK